MTLLIEAIVFFGIGIALLSLCLLFKYLCEKI